MKIKLTDGRILIGIFLCTDKDANVILGTCAEYLTEENSREPRMLGLAMIPGRHIISIHVDETLETSVSKIPAPKNSPTSSSMYNWTKKWLKWLLQELFWDCHHQWWITIQEYQRH